MIAEIEHWDTVANRLYYACFHAVSAYLISKNIQTYTHKGTKAKFHKLIKQSLIDINSGKLYNDLFNKRFEADYQDFVEFDEEAIEPLISETIDFVKKFVDLIPSDYDTTQ